MGHVVLVQSFYYIGSVLVAQLIHLATQPILPGLQSLALSTLKQP
jgi:hypothetical protein